MTAEEIAIDALFVIPLVGLFVYLVYEMLKAKFETKLIKYYTIELSSFGFYKITLWVAEVYIYRNKCKKRPIEVEYMKTQYKCEIDEAEKKYNNSGIYPMYRTNGAEKCLLKNHY